jgi:hypothetical protein
MDQGEYLCVVLMAVSDVGCHAMEQSMNNELPATRRPDSNLQAGCRLGLFKEESTNIGVYDWSRTLLDIGDLSRAFLFFRVSEHPAAAQTSLSNNVESRMSLQHANYEETI